MAHWLLVSRRLVEAVHAAGGEVYVWTVDDAAGSARLEALGVDGVITNDPRLFGWRGERRLADDGAGAGVESRCRVGLASSSAARPTAAQLALVPGRHVDGEASSRTWRASVNSAEPARAATARGPRPSSGTHPPGGGATAR